MKPIPKPAWNADRLDMAAFARAGASLQADEPLTRFARLIEELHPSGVDVSALSVSWSAQGELRPAAKGGAPAVWLHLQARATLPLTCQRCLGPVELPLHVDRWFRFVADEATAATEDDGCDEDLLPLEPRPGLHDLLEDELLMEMPIVPMHDTCPVHVPMQAADPDLAVDEQEPKRPNPFAELAKLKK